MKNGFNSKGRLAWSTLQLTSLFLTGAMLSACVGSGEPMDIVPQSLASVDGATLDGISIDGTNVDGANVDGASLLQQASLDGAENNENAPQAIPQTTAIPIKAPRGGANGRQVAAVSTSENKIKKETKNTPLSSPTPVKKFIKKPVAETQLALLRDGVGEKQARKASFFQRLFQKREKPNNPLPKSKRKLGASASALPGVKSNASIFGVGGEDQEIESQIQLASVGGLGRISPNGLRLQHSKVEVACFKPELLRLLKKVHRKFGRAPIVTSGYRSPRRNRRAGGVSRSQHIYCKAADIQVENVSKWALAKYLRSLPGRGGVGTYCRTKSVHVDVGSKRDWHYPCRRKSVRRKRKS